MLRQAAADFLRLDPPSPDSIKKTETAFTAEDAKDTEGNQKTS